LEAFAGELLDELALAVPTGADGPILQKAGS
jgi:hypothetical protein